MIEKIKVYYRKLRSVYHKLKFIYSINWTKTLYFNFKKFPFETAKKLPVFFYGKVKFKSINGTMVIDAPVKMGMVGFGQPYEMNTLSKGTAEIILEGIFKVKGHVQFGKDYLLMVGPLGLLEMGHLASLGSNGKIICTDEIILGNYARLGSESQIIDTNFHQMIDVVTGERFPMSSPIAIGSYNYIGNRVSIMQKTKTPNYCTVASNSLCNKDYTGLDENILIGGIPATLLRKGISRDWEGEHEMLEKCLII